MDAAKEYQTQKTDWFASNWAGMLPPNVEAKFHDRASSWRPFIRWAAITTLPETFTPHRMVGKIYQQRAEMVSSGKQIDWALAEQLAWGTLLFEGNHVRISGQDVERGTFSHRHCVIHDQKALAISTRH